MKQVRPHWLAVVLLGAALLSPAVRAHDRRFVFSYETIGMPEGEWEIEQWLTWKHYGDKDRLDFRHELEYGISDTLTLDLYLADWRYEKADGQGGGADYRRSGFALRKQLTHPNESFLGSALYGEALIGDEQVVLEGKVLLQKNWGPLIAAYNLIVEAEWEGDSLGSLNERVGVWENTFGLSYQINPSLFAGLEALHEVEFEDWSEAGDHVFYAGPNLSYHHKGFFITIAGLFQVSGLDAEPDAQVRMIAGFKF